MLHPQESAAYVMIPKCASTLMRVFLRDKGWSEGTWTPDVEFTFAFLREPLERYASGWAEMLRRSGRPADTPIAEPFERDEHTTLQSKILSGIRVDKFLLLRKGAHEDLAALGHEPGWGLSGIDITDTSPQIPLPEMVELKRYLEPDIELHRRVGS